VFDEMSKLKDHLFYMQFELKLNYDLWIFSAVLPPSSPQSIARAAPSPTPPW
jgi:hypothetical protein